MALPDQVLGLQEIGVEVSDYWAPSSMDGRTLRLEPGETVLLVGRCRVKSSAEGWTLPDDTTVLITDRRVAFMTLDFDPGGGWVGFGAAGLVVSAAANLVSKHRATKRSAGLVAIGQFRHEWIESVELRKEKALLGPISTYIDLIAITSHGRTDLELWGPRVVDEKLATRLVTLLTWHRSTLDAYMNSSERLELECLRNLLQDDPPDVRNGIKWILPGDIERLIAAVAPNPVSESTRIVPPRPDHAPKSGGSDVNT